MATEKVGIYRNYYGPVPTDSSGKPLPKSQWPKRRAHSWVVRWFGSDGQRYSKSFRTRKEAIRLKEQKQEEVREGRADPPAEIALQGFIEEHEKVMRGQIAGESLADQLRALRMFMKHLTPDMKLQDIQPRHAELFISERLSSDVKVATVNKDIRTLRRVFNLAIEPRGYLPAGQNPFSRIRQRKQSTGPIRYVRVEELRKLLEASPTIWWRALLWLAYTTAARLGEILNLTWADVDFGRSRIHITRKEAGEALDAWEPKDHEERLLPVPEDVLQLLAGLQAKSAKGCPYLFVPSWRWQHIQQARKAGRWREGQSLVNNLNRRLATLRTKAGVEKFTFHDLRRSCITNWARVLPVHVVRKLAGHSDIKTTQKYYLAVEEDDLERARQTQFAILEVDPTDQIMTNSGKNELLSAEKREEPDS